MHARRKPLGRSFDLILKPGIHRTRLRAGDRLDLAGTGSRPISLVDERTQSLLERGEPVEIGIAKLDLHLGAAGDDGGRVWLEQHAADRPHCARTGDFRKAVVNPGREPHHRDTGIPAPFHTGGAGMVLLADEGDPVVPDADNRLDDADTQSAGVERVALLDMRFEVTNVTQWLDPLIGPLGKARTVERFTQRRPVIAAAGLVDFLFGERIGKGAAAETIAVMAFFVCPSGDLDTEPATGGVRSKSAGEFEPVDHPQRTIKPTAIGLGFAVRADEEPALRLRITADHIADPVDYRVEPGFTKLAGQPLPRLDVDGRIGRTMHAGLVAAEFRKPFQIGDNALSIDGRHLLWSPRGVAIGARLA